MPLFDPNEEQFSFSDEEEAVDIRSQNTSPVSLTTSPIELAAAGASKNPRLASPRGSTPRRNMFGDDGDAEGKKKKQKKKKKKKKPKASPPSGSGGGGFLSRVLGFGSSASTTMTQDFDVDQAEDEEDESAGSGEKDDAALSLSIYDRTATGRQRGGRRTELPAMTSPPRPKLRLGFGGSSEEEDLLRKDHDTPEQVANLCVRIHEQVRTERGICEPSFLKKTSSALEGGEGGEGERDGREGGKDEGGGDGNGGGGQGAPGRGGGGGGRRATCGRRAGLGSG